MKQDRPETASNPFGHDQTGLLDLVPLPLLFFRLDDGEKPIIVHATPALQRLAAVTHGGFVADLASDDEAEALVNACRQAIARPDQPQSFHLRIADDNGQTLAYSGQALGTGRYDAALGSITLCQVGQDMALQRRMASEMREAAMQTLVAGLVHDFRNTLTHIIGTSELLLFKSEDPEITHDLNQILKSGEQGAESLNRLQKMIRLPSDEERSETISPVDLAARLELLRSGLPAGIHMQTQLQSPLPGVAMGLPQLSQILQALIANAAEAITGSGRIEVELGATHAHRFNTSSEALFIRVGDNGHGIAREDLEPVTHPFWTTRDDPGRLGLGLAIVSRLVRLHGGRLDIRSRPGFGTTVSILLPPHGADSGSGEVPPAHAKPARSALGKAPETATTPTTTTDNMRPWRILLVDDSPEVLQVHQGMLERMGHHITAAFNAYEALNIFSEKHAEFDLLVTDFRMPGMDGVDLAHAVREINTDLHILMITAYGDASKLQQLHELHIELLDKPVSYARLEQRLITLQQG